MMEVGGMNERRETRLMTKTTRMLAFGCVAAWSIGQPALAETADQRCVKGADIRRIEIRFPSDTGAGACKVVYRPEVESDTLGITSWQNIPSLAACEVQADEVVQRLTAEGWTCSADRQADEANNVAELFEQDAAPGVEPSRAPPISEAPNPESAAPESDESIRPPAVGADGSTVVRGDDEPARLIDNPDIAPPPADLASRIKDDLDQLDTTLDGVLEAEIAGYGDLNADDVDDALVLYSYSSPQPAYRQFLAIYLFDGETYRLTATRPVGGTFSATTGARVETIDQGIIHLVLGAFEPGDESCCPSGTRHIALALRELDLVKIDVDAPTR